MSAPAEVVETEIEKFARLEREAGEKDGAVVEPAPEPAPEPVVEPSPVEPPKVAKPEPSQDSQHASQRRRIRQESEARRTAELEVARLRGENEALRAMAVKPADQPGTALTPTEELASIRQQRLDLAQKFDNGEITAVEREKQSQQLEDRTSELRQAMVKPAPVRVEDINDNPVVAEHSASLEKDYPVLVATRADGKPVLTDAIMQALIPLAIAEADADGVKVRGGALATMNLRTYVAKVATRVYGHVKPPEKPPTLSAGAKALEVKLEAADNAPPDVSKVGAVGKAGDITEAEAESRMNSMNEDERLAFMASMPGLRKKLLG